jgi:RNA recognition motif-containing protein
LSVRLFIGNLPFAATEADLRAYFSAVGAPQQVVLPMDRATGRPRGFAFIEYENRETAEEAIRKFDRQVFMGRPLAVSEARGRDERPSGPRPGGGFAPRPGGFAPRPAGGGFSPRPMSAPGGDTDASPASRDRSRNFGPDAKPRRAGSPARRQAGERGPKGPIREKPDGRVYSVDEDEVEEPIDFDNVATRADADAPPDESDE